MAEAEYISKEAALACFSDWIDRYGHEHSAEEMAEYQRIEDLLPADVVEVVRCKDCKYYLPYEVDRTDGKCKRWNGLVVYDDYCSGADMREVTPCSY